MLHHGLSSVRETHLASPQRKRLVVAPLPGEAAALTAYPLPPVSAPRYPSCAGLSTDRPSRARSQGPPPVLR